MITPERDSPMMKNHFRSFFDFTVKRTFPIILTPQVPKRKITILINAVLDDAENKIIKVMPASSNAIIYAAHFTENSSHTVLSNGNFIPGIM